MAKCHVEAIRLRLLKIAAQVPARERSASATRRLTPRRGPSSRLGRHYAVEETPNPKAPPPVAKQKAAARLKHSGKTNAGWLSDRETNAENGNKKNLQLAAELTVGLHLVRKAG